jgi:hypothetical protein
MSPGQVTLTLVGSTAHQLLAHAQEASVWGVTSRGLFLHLSIEPGWVIFISTESFAGPLTLNSSPLPALFKTLKPGMPVFVRSGNLYFPAQDLILSADKAVVWSPPSPLIPSPDQILSIPQRIESLYHQITNLRPELNASHLLDAHPGSASARLAPQQFGLNSSSLLETVQALLIQGPSISSLLESFLGFGPGLTPAGDDLVLGFLLTINRWEEVLHIGCSPQELNPILRMASYRKTNTLSANLIECASLGYADERLIQALDGIITGEPGLDVCASHLLGWGNSSGANALAGIALATLVN